MTFSEYFNGLYPYLSDGINPASFFDEMISHFIYEEAQEACKLLSCKPDTKSRYIRKKDPNKIKSEFAQYAYSKHNPLRYKEWLHDRMYQQDSFVIIEKWLNDNDTNFYDVCVACDELLENIFLDIAHPNASDGLNVQLPTKGNHPNVGSSLLLENDIKLLKEFHADFDSILEKCIGVDHAEIWFVGGMAAKINTLYNDKWKTRINEFIDISLQSDTLNAIATLQMFCNALDPDRQPNSGSSVRKLRMKLRNIYVKIHSENYVDIFPYDAFIDDWNDGEDYDW